MLSLLLVIAPVSAFAESLTATTNKDIYGPEEKAIVVGIIPDDAPEGYSVLINVTGPKGGCATENTLPTEDHSFRSRPIKLDKCGFGEFIVSVYYADQKTTSSFSISNSSITDIGSRLELRTLKSVLLQALSVVNNHVREIIEQGNILPEGVTTRYSKGVSEASLALQAIEVGDAAGAKKHMLFALRDLRELRNELSGQNMQLLKQNQPKQEAENNFDIIDTYNRLEGYYNRLTKLAEKNKLENNTGFRETKALLNDARNMIDKGDIQGAIHNLDQVNSLLEKIRANLYQVEDEENENKANSEDNNTKQREDEARKLLHIASEYRKDALELLNKTDSLEAKLKLQEALGFIIKAVADTDAENLDLARDDLRSANHAIREAKELIEGDDDENSNEDSSDDDNEDEESEDNSRNGSNEKRNDKDQ